jgi:hypothetical protein
MCAPIDLVNNENELYLPEIYFNDDLPDLIYLEDDDMPELEYDDMPELEYDDMPELEYDYLPELQNNIEDEQMY